MSEDASYVVTATRKVRAPAHEIFEVLVRPRRHVDIDGSGMLRGTEAAVLSGLGDEFLMKMYYEQFGDYVMKNVVVEFEEDRRIVWEPERHDTDDDEHWHHRWGFVLAADGPGATDVTEFYDCSRSPEHARQITKNGTVWLDAMIKSLERLDDLFAGGAPSD